MVQDSTKRTGDDQPRINVWRLGKLMLFALVLPCMLAMVFDSVANTWPFGTLLVACFAFPIAGILVMRASLQELQKVIDEVAPENPADSHAQDDGTDRGAEDESAKHVI
jgi:hypothetical protein